MLLKKKVNLYLDLTLHTDVFDNQWVESGIKTYIMKLWDV